MAIATPSEDASVADLLRAIANSVAFADNAPTDQTQLSAPDQMPDYLTIEAYQQMIDDGLLASEAVNYRLQTGKVAIHLLESMSDRAIKEYARQVANAASYIAEMDRQRGAQALPLPTTTPTGEGMRG